MPPPNCAKSATKDAPKPYPTSMRGISCTSMPPSRPTLKRNENTENKIVTPSTVMPTTINAANPPARSATVSASRAPCLALLATRTFARTLTHIPTYPLTPLHTAPLTKLTVVSVAIVNAPTPASCCSGVVARNKYTKKIDPATTPANRLINPYCVAKNPSAPSRIASLTARMSSLPSSTASVHRARCPANANDPAHATNTLAAVHDARHASKKHTTAATIAAFVSAFASRWIARCTRL